MNSKQFLKEGFIEDAHEAHMDHEVQMARVDCYYAAEHAIVLHKLLRNISEEQGLEGWVASKITLANDYLKSVREHLEYQMMNTDADEEDFLPLAEGLTSVKKKLSEAADSKDIQEFERGPWYIIVKGEVVPEDDGSPRKFNWLNAAKVFFRKMLDDDPTTAAQLKSEYDNATDKKSVVYYSKKLPSASSDNSSLEESEKRPGLWANIRAKRERIKAGSGERMRKPGSKGAPTNKDLKSIRASSESMHEDGLNLDKKKSDFKNSLNLNLGSVRGLPINAGIQSAQTPQSYSNRPGASSMGLQPSLSIGNPESGPFAQISKQGGMVGYKKTFEDLGPEQKRVGQLGPTEKVKKNSGARGKLVGANESVEQGVAEGSTNKTLFIIYYKTGKGFDAGTGDVGILASNEQKAKEKFAKKYPHFIVTKIVEGMKYVLVDYRGNYFKGMDKFGRNLSTRNPEEAEIFNLERDAKDIALWTRNRFKAIPWSGQQGVAEANVSKYKDLGATNATTHFLKNVTTGEIISPHRSRADADEALQAATNKNKEGHKFTIVRARKQGVAEGYSLKKTNVEKTFHPGDPEDFGSVDMTRKDTDYEIINNKTGQVVGTASWTTNDYFGPGAIKITMKNGATRYLDIKNSDKGNPQSAFNRFVKDPSTSKKYKEQGVAKGYVNDASEGTKFMIVYNKHHPNPAAHGKPVTGDGKPWIITATDRRAALDKAHEYFVRSQTVSSFRGYVDAVPVEQGVAEGEDVDDTPATERVFKYNKNDPERLIARMEKEIQKVESEGWTIVSKRESPKTGNIVVKMIKKQGVAEAKSPEEFMAQISKSNSSILTNKKESPYYIAGKMLSKYADKIGQDSMDFSDFKQQAALLMGGPEDNMRSAKQVRNLDTAARDIILDMIWEYSSTQKDADTYYKISGFKRLRESTKSTRAGVAEGSDVEYIVVIRDEQGKRSIRVSALTPTDAKEKAEAQGYKVLKVKDPNEKHYFREQGVAEEQINEMNPMLVRDGLQVVIDFLSQYPQATALTAGAAGTAIVAKLVKNAWKNHKELEQLKQDVRDWSIQKLHSNKNVSAKGGKVAKIIQAEIERRKQGVAEGSNDLYQKAIRKYAQQVANDYLNGGNEYLYGANKFDAEIFGVSQEKANKDFKTWFTMIVRSQAVRPRRGVAEGSEQDLVYISKDRAEAFEEWMNSEGLETNVPKNDYGTYVVYDYSNEDPTSKLYASEWNEKREGVAASKNKSDKKS